MRSRKIAFIMTMAAAVVTVATVLTMSPAQANHPGSVSTLRVNASPTLIRHVEFSMLYGNKPGKPRVTPSQVHRDLVTLSKRTDLITMTEIVTSTRANAVRLDGWGLCWHPGTDAGVLYNKDMFYQNWYRSRKVSDTRYYSEMGNRWVLPGHITACMLTVKATGKTVLVTAGHAVSCVMSRRGDGWIPRNQLCGNGATTSNRAYIQRNPRRIAAYKDHLNGWAKWDKALEATYKPDVNVLTGDFNLDFKKFWVRKYLSTVFDGKEMSWRKWAPEDYTHLMRTYHGIYHVLLDGDFVSGEGVTYQRGSVSFPEMVSSDHSPVETLIRIPG
jgi:hypothetical protein